MYIDSDRTYVGIVEDNLDPLKLGRCKVRVVDVFDNIPKEDIPWASPWKDLNGNTYNLPGLNKIVTVIFDSGNIYKPEYIYADHYNINLQEKLKKLTDQAYTSMKSIMFDHKTQIYSNDDEGLIVDYKYNNINITDKEINLNLKDNAGKIHLGDMSGDQQAILGTNFLEWFDRFLNTLIATGFIDPVTKFTTVATAPLVGLIQEYRANKYPRYLSDNVWLNDNRYIFAVPNLFGPLRENNQLAGDEYKTTMDLSKPAPKFNQNQDKTAGNQDKNFKQNETDNGNEKDKAPPPKKDEHEAEIIKNDEKKKIDNAPKSNPVYQNPQDKNSPITTEFAKALVDVAKSQVGTKERTDSSYPKGNTGPEIIGYQQSTIFGGTGWPWNAAFITWCFEEVVKRNPGIGYSFPLPKIASSTQFQVWAQTNSNFIQTIKNPTDGVMPGDIILFKNPTIHCGIATGNSDGSGNFKCVEGNTDASGTTNDGDGVYEITRKQSSIDMVLRINYNKDLVKEVKPKQEEAKQNSNVSKEASSSTGKVNKSPFPVYVEDSYTADDCDELHAFQSTNGITIGNMNVTVGKKITELNNLGYKVKPNAVVVTVNDMKVNWQVELVESDINWTGFTSRGAGCNNKIELRAGDDATYNNGPLSIKAALAGQGKTLDKIEVVDEITYQGGPNSFKQIFYRYTLTGQSVPDQPKNNANPPTVKDIGEIDADNLGFIKVNLIFQNLSQNSTDKELQDFLKKGLYLSIITGNSTLKREKVVFESDKNKPEWHKSIQILLLGGAQSTFGFYFGEKKDKAGAFPKLILPPGDYTLRVDYNSGLENVFWTQTFKVPPLSSPASTGDWFADEFLFKSQFFWEDAGIDVKTYKDSLFYEKTPDPDDVIYEFIIRKHTVENAYYYEIKYFGEKEFKKVGNANFPPKEWQLTIDDVRRTAESEARFDIKLKQKVK